MPAKIKRTKRPPGFPRSKDKMSEKQRKDCSEGAKARRVRQSRKSGIFKFKDDLEAIGSSIFPCENQSKLHAALAAVGVFGAAYGSYKATKGMQDTISEAVGAAVQAGNKAADAAEALKDGINKASRDGIEVKHNVNFEGVLDGLIERLTPGDKTKSMFAAIKKIVAAIVLVYAAYLRSPMAFVGAAALAAYVYRESAGELLAVIFSTEKQSSDGDDDDSRFNLFKLIFEFVVGHQITEAGFTPNRITISSFVKKCVTIGGAVRNLRSLYEIIITGLRFVIGSLWLVVTGKECPLAFVQGPDVDIYKCISAYQEYSAKYRSQQIVAVDYLYLLRETQKRARELLKGVPSTSKAGQQLSQVMVKINEMIISVAAAVGEGAGERTEPVAYLFVGPAKTGKSTMVHMLSKEFAVRLATPSQREAWAKAPASIAAGIWHQDAHSKYADGYDAQKVHVIEEVGPKPLGDEMPWPALLKRYVNVAPYMLNQASVERKGNVYYHANLILGSSNHENWSAPSGADFGAMSRRLHFVYVDVDPSHGVKDPDTGRTCLSERKLKQMKEAQERFNRGESTADAYYEEAYKGINFRVVDVVKSKGAVDAVAPATVKTANDIRRDIVAQLSKNKSWTQVNTATNERILEAFQSQAIKQSGGAICPSPEVGQDMEEFMRCVDSSMDEAAERIQKPVLDPTATIRFIPADHPDYIHDINQGPKITLCDTARDLLRKCQLYTQDHVIHGFPIWVNQIRASLELNPGLTSLTPYMGVLADLASVYAPTMRASIEVLQQVRKDWTKEQRNEFKDHLLRYISLGDTLRCLVFDERMIPTPDDEVMHFAYHIARSHHEQVVAATSVTVGAQLDESGFSRLAVIGAVTMTVAQMVCAWYATKLVLNSIGLIAEFLKGDEPVESQSDPPLKDRKGQLRKKNASLKKALNQSGNKPVLNMVGNIVSQNVVKYVVHSEKDKPLETMSQHGTITMVQNNVGITSKHISIDLQIAHADNPGAWITFLNGRTRVCHLLSNLMDMDTRHEVTGPDGEIHSYHQLKFVSQIGVGDDADMCAIWLPLGGYRCIVKHFIGQAVVKDHPCFSSRATLRRRDVHGIACNGEGSASPVRNAKSVYAMEDGDRVYYGDELISYQVGSVVGDCGAPVTVMYNGNPAVVAIHCSGRPSLGVGYGVRITREMVDSAVRDMVSVMEGTVVQEEELLDTIARVTGSVDEDVAGETPAITMSGRNSLSKPTRHCGLALMEARQIRIDDFGIKGLGLVALASVRRPKLNTETMLLPSPIADHLPFILETAPAMLKPFESGGQLFDPMAVAMTGYGRGEKTYNHHLVGAVNQYLMQWFLRFPVLDAERRSYTWEEVVASPVDLLNVRGIDRSTSAGMPCVLANDLTKRLLFGTDEYTFTSESWCEVVSFMEDAEDMMDRGIRPPLFFMSFLKDERRLKEKVDKPRLISAASLPLVLLMRKYMMGLVNYITRNRIQNGVALGVCPFTEWTALANYHGVYRKGDNPAASSAGDHSKYDKNLPSGQIMHFADMADKFYDDKGTRTHRIRRALFYELAHSRHVYKNYILEWDGSNSSGNYVTTPVNSYSNMLYIRTGILVCYLEARGEAVAHSTVVRYHDHVFGPQSCFRVTAYGDDILVSYVGPIDEVNMYFSHEKLAWALYQQFGITYTDDTKGIDTVGLRRLEDVTFLKRGFAFNYTNYPLEVSCPRELGSIVDALRWMRKSRHGHDATLEHWKANVHSQLQELSLHTREVFDEQVHIITRACQRAGFQIVPMGYSHYQELARGTDVLY